MADRLTEELRVRARALIAAGKLPGGVPPRTWSGYGSEVPCSLCADPIRRSEVEYEVEVPLAAGARVFRFHFDCHTAWQLECALFQTPR